MIALGIGVMIGGVPVGAFAGYCKVQEQAMEEKYLEAKERLDGQTRGEVYIVNKDKHKGDTLSENDYSICEVFTNSEEEMPLAASVAQDMNGKILRLNMKEGSILSADLLDNHQVTDDVRLQEISWVELNEEILDGSIIVIRIVYPNGEDYIVLGHKRIEKRVENTIYLNVTEEEILLMASAKVDCEKYDGSRTYGILYVKDYQEAAVKNYPANEYVCSLSDWDPNIVKEVFSEEMKQKRMELEQHLVAFSMENS